MIAAIDALGAKDRRRDMPRFQAGNLEHNLGLVETLRERAGAEGRIPVQPALAWLLARHPFVVPLPGTRQRRWLEENARAVDLTPTSGTLQALDQAFGPGAARGTRYPEAQLKRLGI